MKTIRVFFLSENFQLLEVKFSIYLNRRDFVMRRRGEDRTGHNETVAIPDIQTKNINERNDQESIQLPTTFRLRHQRETGHT